MSRSVVGKRSFSAALTLKNRFSVSLANGEVIGLTAKRVHERDRKVDSRSFSHERRLRSVAVRFKSETQQSCLDDALAVTGEAFGDKSTECSPGGFVVSADIVA